MPLLSGRGKKPAKPLREGDRGFSRPSGLIRPFEVAWDAPINGLMETTMTAVIEPAQGHGLTDRVKTRSRESKKTKA